MGSELTYPGETLERLHRARYHGAGNIKGVDYQILVAVDCALRVMRGEAKGIALEGLEDVDVLAPRPAYVQAKAGGLDWTVFKNALISFNEVWKREPEATFEFVVAGKLTKDLRNLKKLCEGEALPPMKRMTLTRRLESACPGINAELLIERHLYIRPVTRIDLWSNLVHASVEIFETSFETAPLYLVYLVSRLLEWSGSRTVVSQDMLQQVIDEALTAIAMESTGFEALTAGYVSKISWIPDAAPDDFRAGKAVREGHIALDLDVRRPVWEEEIGRALDEVGVCVIRGASGQGKSTLMYRYARSYLPNTEIYRLNWAGEVVEVEAVRQFLDTKHRLGRKVHLLIDGGDWRTKFWPRVVAKSVACGFPVIAAIRNEDFWRFGGVVGFRIAEVRPGLDLIEGRELYRDVEESGRLHPDAPGAEAAYELLSMPKLLMEYWYLLTHGQALRERLEEQVYELERGDKPDQVAALRIIAMAHSLGASVPISRLMTLPSFNGEAQRLLGPLDSEYLSAESGRVWGLHWVRSDHLYELLHGDFADPVDTFRDVLAVINDVDHERVIERAFLRGIDEMALLGQLAEWVGTDSDRLLLALRGTFAAAVRSYATDNESVFQEAYEEVGMSSVRLLAVAAHVTPNSILESFGGDTGLAWLAELAKKLGEPRYLGNVAALLNRLAESGALSESLAIAPLAAVGEILDWLATSGARVPDWDVRSILGRFSVQNVEIQQLADLCHGYARYDESGFGAWVSETSLCERLALEIDAMTFQVKEEKIHFEFLVTPHLNLDDLNGEAMARVNLLRRALPGLTEYRCHPFSVLHYQRIPGVPLLEDAAFKTIAKDSIPAESDVQKNVLIAQAIRQLFQATTLYDYAQQWCEVRHETAALLSTYAEFLRPGRIKNNTRSTMPTAGVHRAMNRLRPPSPSASTAVIDAGKAASEWTRAIDDFMAAAGGKNTSAERAIDALYRAVGSLPALNDFFDVLRTATDGFEFGIDQKTERKTYLDLTDMIVRATPVAGKRVRVPAQLQSALSDGGFIVGSHVVRVDGLRCLGLARDFGQLDDFDCRLSDAAKSLPAHEGVDFYFMVVLTEGQQALPNGFRVRVAAASETEGYIGLPLEMPEEVRRTLPNYNINVPLEFRIATAALPIQNAVLTGANWASVLDPVEGDALAVAFCDRQQERMDSWVVEMIVNLRLVIDDVRSELPNDVVDDLEAVVDMFAKQKFDEAITFMGWECPDQ